MQLTSQQQSQTTATKDSLFLSSKLVKLQDKIHITGSKNNRNDEDNELRTWMSCNTQKFDLKTWKTLRTKADPKSDLFAGALDVAADDVGLLRADGGSHGGVLVVGVADHHPLRPLHQAIQELRQDAPLNKHSRAVGAHLDDSGEQTERSVCQPRDYERKI